YLRNPPRAANVKHQLEKPTLRPVLRFSHNQMKTTLKLLLVGILAVLRCSLVNAQIIYSNNFSLGGTGNISNTPPTVANNYAGGTNTAAWNDVLGTHDSGSLQANGLDNTTLAD